MSHDEMKIQTAKPDFEHNLADFEANFFSFVSQTDPNFDLNLLRHNNLAPVVALNPNHKAELMYPTTKYELRLPIRLATPQTINSDIVGNQVILESNIRVKGNIFGMEEVFIGPNCVIEGCVIGGEKVRVEEGSVVNGTITAETIELSGPVEVGGPVVSRGDLTVTGSLKAEALLAGNSVFLMGAPGDEVRLASSYIIACKGDIETAVPVFLGTGVAANLDTQKFYFSQNGSSFRLIRAHQAGIELHRPEHNTILTVLTDADLEKLLAELTLLEQRA